MHDKILNTYAAAAITELACVEERFFFEQRVHYGCNGLTGARVRCTASKQFNPSLKSLSGDE